MEPFKTTIGSVAVLDWTDVNTDLIIPARYLKRIERTGYGPLLFADKRYLPGTAPDPDTPEHHGPLDPAFPLNREECQKASILVVGKNFGCGSSREHAVWAVSQAGFRVLIAPGQNEGFADIFEQNAFNNGVLPIELPEPDWARLVAAAHASKPLRVEVDLEHQSLRILAVEGEFTIPFSIPDAQRQRLLQGLDSISETLAHETAIARYEATAPPWVIQ